MKKVLLSFALLFSVMAGLSVSVRPAAAITLLDDALIREASCVDENNKTISGCTPSLNTFVKVGLNISRIILGVVGALTLAMFVYGGITLMLSGGSSEAVSRGKQIITGAIVGLIIVFVSYTVISFVINSILQAKVGGQPAFTGSSPSGTTNNQTTQDLTVCGSGNALETCIGTSENCAGGTVAKKCGVNQKCCKTQPTCQSQDGDCFNDEQACMQLGGVRVSATGCEPGVCCYGAQDPE